MNLLIDDLDYDLTLDRQALSMLLGGKGRRGGGNQFALVIVNINRKNQQRFKQYTPIVPLLRVNF